MALVASWDACGHALGIRSRCYSVPIGIRIGRRKAGLEPFFTAMLIAAGPPLMPRLGPAAKLT